MSFNVFFFLQLHLSFSLSTGGEDGLKEKRDKELIPVQSLNLLLKSIGATLTDVQDVVFKYECTRRPKYTKNKSHTIAFSRFVVGLMLLDLFHLLFQAGLLRIDLPVLYHSAATIGSH